MQDWFKILTVDDDPIYHTHHQLNFISDGFYHRSVANAPQAFELLQQEHYGVAIIDERMPNPGDGLRLAQQIKEAEIDTQVIILTGYDDEKEARRALTQGYIAGWLNKHEIELEFEEILALVCKLFAKRSERFIVYVEGAHDEQILRVAWQQLYDMPLGLMPFVLQSVDGVPNLITQLGGQPSRGHMVCGIFDHDKAGIDGYHKTFKSSSTDIREGVKRSNNHASGCFYLPSFESRADYAKYQTLSLEFYFDDEVLKQKNETGLGLIFGYHKEVTRINGQIKSQQPSTLPAARKIDSGKNIFANEIVPNLEREKFTSFELIFDQIWHLYNHLR